MQDKFILIDVGNTALKWATLDNPDNPETIVHNGQGHFKRELFERWKQINPTHVLGCTVAAPEIAFSLTKFFNEHRIHWDWVRATERFEGKGFVLHNDYSRTKQLGADRWYAAIGALAHLSGESLLVVHMGTATTVDSILRESETSYRFLGGRIAPGPSLMHTSLLATIPTLTAELGVYSAMPSSSQEAIATGIIDAQVGLVMRAIEAMHAKGVQPHVLLAGGAAQFIGPHLLAEIPDLIIRHNLVLGGLASRALQTIGES